MQAAVFLDRDGTLILDKGYPSCTSKVELVPGIEKRLQKWTQEGYLLVVVSNQSGVGRGLIDEMDVHYVNDRLQDLLRPHGVGITCFYHCPHLPTDNCFCRKPKPGLLYRAAAELRINLGESLMYGDKESDLMAGVAAGCKSSIRCVTDTPGWP